MHDAYSGRQELWRAIEDNRQQVPGREHASLAPQKSVCREESPRWLTLGIVVASNPAHAFCCGKKGGL